MEVFEVLIQKSFSFFFLHFIIVGSQEDIPLFFSFPPNALFFFCKTACCAAPPNSLNVFTVPITTVIIHNISLIYFFGVFFVFF